MHNFEHKQLIQAIGRLDEVPDDRDAFSQWILADSHLTFLRENAPTNELVIYASGEFTFINAVVVPSEKISPADREDLMSWSLNPFNSIASYVTGGDRDEVWIERGLSGTGTKGLDGALPLIFGRTFEGWTGVGRNYFELHQEYAHLTDIHWRPERRAYCRFDDNGDLEPVVSVTTRNDLSDISLVSFKWEPLEEYLVAARAVLVRMFDFTLMRRSAFSGWADSSPENFTESENFFYHRNVMPGHAAYTRGVQIIRPRNDHNTVFARITNSWFGPKDKRHVEFIAYDWRNQRIAKISTDPSATTNYFDAEQNSLPFELSPAFFRPEVLLKYKADREKYTVGERDVSCRAAWHLEGIDVNEAGQVHAYICYLRRLPYTEQLHWLSYNDPPRTGISERAVVNDFMGEFVMFMEPLRKVTHIAQRWHDTKVAWWTLRGERLIERVNTPLSASQDEWAEAFMDLAKLVVEGFEVKTLRAALDAARIPYGKEERTIALLERVVNREQESGEPMRLDGLRTVQLLRTKAKGHASGSNTKHLVEQALTEHETLANHFRHVCALVAEELEVIENCL